MPEVDRDDRRRQAEGRGLDHLQPACRAPTVRPRAAWPGTPWRPSRRPGAARPGPCRRSGRAPGPGQSRPTAGRSPHGAGRGAAPFFLGEPRVAVCDEFHRCGSGAWHDLLPLLGWLPRDLVPRPRLTVSRRPTSTAPRRNSVTDPRSVRESVLDQLSGEAPPATRPVRRHAGSFRIPQPRRGRVRLPRSCSSGDRWECYPYQTGLP